MTLKKLWKLCIDASSNTAEFKEHYDFAGAVGHEPVLKLLIEREDLRGAMESVISLDLKSPAGQIATLKLREALNKSDAAWPKEPVDGGGFSF